MFPFLPDLLAAYRDPSTDIGAFLHRVKARIQASGGTEYDILQHAQFRYSALPERPSPTPSEEDSIYERLENALFILPRVRSSAQQPQHQHTRSQSQSQSQTLVGRDVEEGKFVGDDEETREKMRPFPRFTLFVTAPNDQSDANTRSQQP